MGISQNVCQQHDVFGRLLRNPQMVSPDVMGDPQIIQGAFHQQ